MILIDTNAFILLILGMIDKSLISSHKTTSIYTEQDFIDLLKIIRKAGWRKILVLPNVWTEVDNLLNRLAGSYKWPYIKLVRKLLEQTNERYLTSESGAHGIYFANVGLTDSLLVELGKECELFVTADSSLSNIATANGINVYDIVQRRNEDLRK